MSKVNIQKLLQDKAEKELKWSKVERDALRQKIKQLQMQLDDLEFAVMVHQINVDKYAAVSNDK